MFTFDHGIRISGTSFWLDAHRKVEFSFVSHAHADHIRPHKQLIATPQTISLIQTKNRKINAVPLPFYQQHDLEDIRIELFPAGHILGSAQILVMKDDLKLVYTGDFKTDKNATAEQCEIREADVLIMECTFGSPKYVFPKKWVLIEKLVKFINDCFRKGIVPVIMGYRTGKAQEALKLLGDLDFQISIHASIEPVVKVYEKYGVTFKNYQTYHGEDLRDRVLLIPPHLAKASIVHKLWKTKKLVLTGWVTLPNGRYRYAADEILPFSDHADYNQLLEYVHQVSPKKIFITHGFESFVHDLRRHGFQAELLQESPQMSLF